MVRSTYLKTIAIEKIMYYLQFLRRRETWYHAGPHGEAPGLNTRQKKKVEAWAGAFTVLLPGKVTKVG